MIAALAYKTIAADYIAFMRARGLDPILLDDSHLALECEEGTPRLTRGEDHTLTELHLYMAMALYDNTVERRMNES